ncbi:hypothetical protein GCM10023322_62470 [Rugosimonospora acidiphila]|uniref:Hydrogenase maturation protease n=1 Tax=Rugosimonospora acidiphila TaxID=556531 RepID=A0ABP9SJ21_9ACTN
MSGPAFWERMASRGPDSIEVGGVRLRAGSLVRLRPQRHSDILDLALDGRTAVVESIEQDDEGRVQLAVTVSDDPGRDLGDARMPGHRFFYTPDDVEPVQAVAGAGAPGTARVLVAGIGNLFLGDDGFGCEVARLLLASPAIPGVDVVDFGIRGLDLAYALLRDYRAAILIDASPRGYVPGTLTVIEPRLTRGGPVDLQTHGMDPVRVLALARELGGVPATTYVVCCEPESIPVTGPDEEVVVALSAPVRGALITAAGLVRSLARELLAGPAGAPEPGGRTGSAGKVGEAREEDAVGRGAAERRVGHHRGGRAVARDPAVPEDAADVTAPPVASVGGGGGAGVPGHPR